MSTTYPTSRTLTAASLTHREQALLSAAAAGRVEICCSCEPDLFVDGLCCCDQAMAHRLAHAGLIAPSIVGPVGSRVAAVLTDSGFAALEVIS